MRRDFRILDVDCVVTVWDETRKNLLDYLDVYVENLSYDWFDGSYDSFLILYKDGSSDYIDEEYDGHKIKRQHIASIVYSNPEDYQVFGNFEIGEYGSVYPSFEERISECNIKEIA